MKYELLTKLRDELNQLLETPNPNLDQQKITNKPDMLCVDCKKTIPTVVADYSQKWYGKHLCRECQFKHPKKEEA